MNLSEYQDAVIERLKAAGLLAGPPAIPIFRQVDGDQKAEREKALADVGMCLYVQLPRIARTNRRNELSYFVSVAVHDNPGIRARNHLTICSIDMAWLVFAALAGWSPDQNYSLAGEQADTPVDLLTGDTPLGKTAKLSFVDISNTSMNPYVVYVATMSTEECYQIVQT